jgi:DNA-binding XRE family transcriptional regulator
VGREAQRSQGDRMTTPQLSADDLRTVRYHMDLTQAELAERLGVAVRTIVNWEATGVPAFRARSIYRILGGTIREALDEELRVALSRATAAENHAALIPAPRRAELLHPFTDLDLLSELQTRALRREAARAT